MANSGLLAKALRWTAGEGVEVDCRRRRTNSPRRARGSWRPAGFRLICPMLAECRGVSRRTPGKRDVTSLLDARMPSWLGATYGCLVRRSCCARTVHETLPSPLPNEI